MFPSLTAENRPLGPVDLHYQAPIFQQSHNNFIFSTLPSTPPDSTGHLHINQLTRTSLRVNVLCPIQGEYANSTQIGSGNIGKLCLLTGN